jgi:hypothetical protein
MGIICEACGRDIDALGQDNMGVDAPLCEDCWNERQGRAAESLRREVRDLRFENARLREKLDAKVEDAVDPTWVCRMRNTAVQNLRKDIEAAYKVSRERALALTKLDECEMWLGRCEPKETAAPTLEGAAQDAAMPCLKDAHVELNVELRPDALADAAAKSLRESMQPALRMAVR